MRGRATSCHCAVLGHMAPCSWCTEYSRPCEGCGEIFDREDMNEAGYCGQCEEDHVIKVALESSKSVGPIDMALFGLDEDGNELPSSAPRQRDGRTSHYDRHGQPCSRRLSYRRLNVRPLVYRINIDGRLDVVDSLSAFERHSVFSKVIFDQLVDDLRSVLSGPKCRRTKSAIGIGLESYRSLFAQGHGSRRTFTALLFCHLPLLRFYRFISRPERCSAPGLFYLSEARHA
jgi:hypothetical protein